ncbi:MAG: hypothetical protein M0Q91_12605 [Methanoregula sp.]|jgi:hypothetical protein|nr:hypothetical protein [Methanoregula sp.]
MTSYDVVVPLQGGGKVALPIATGATGDQCVVFPLQDGGKAAVKLTALATGDQCVVIPLQDGGKVAIPLVLPPAVCACCAWSWDGWTQYGVDQANCFGLHYLIEFNYVDGAWVITPEGGSTDHLSPPCLTKYNDVSCTKMSTGITGFNKTPDWPPYSEISYGMEKTLSSPVTITGFKIYMYCEIQVPGDGLAYILLNDTVWKRVVHHAGWGLAELKAADFDGGSLELSNIKIYRFASYANNGYFLIYCSGMQLLINGSWVCFDSTSY